MIPRFEAIAVHHAAYPDQPGVDRNLYVEWHRARGFETVGYHFVVEKVGDVYLSIAGRPLFRAGAHAYGHNTSHIGVCLAGDFSAYPPPEAQLDAAAELIAGLIAQTGIDPRRIESHRELGARGGSTKCPGDAFPMARLRRKVWYHLGYEPPHVA